MKLIQGAEAHITGEKHTIIKTRNKKAYRIPELDEKIRRQRTKTEARLLIKAYDASVAVPKVVTQDIYTLTLEKLPGKKLAEVLDTLRHRKECAAKLGILIAQLHDAQIIHGDLTTSNIIYSKGKLSLIDFGLGFSSQRPEDKATDLHVLKEALEAKHYRSAQVCWKAVLQGYQQHSPHASVVLKRLTAVEKRGRYKAQY